MEPCDGGYRLNYWLVFWYWKKNLKPGWYIWHPWFQHVEVINIVPKTLDLLSQSAETKDGEQIVFAMGIRYSIKDPSAACLNVEGYEDSLSTTAMGVAEEYITTKTRDEIRDIKRTADDIRQMIVKECRGYGLKIERVYITDNGKSRNIRLISGS